MLLKVRPFLAARGGWMPVGMQLSTVRRSGVTRRRRVSRSCGLAVSAEVVEPRLLLAAAIVVGDHVLLANTAGQTIDIVATGDSDVTGINVRAQLGDGLGAQAEPVFDGVSYAGSIWTEPATTTGGPVGGAEQFLQSSIVFNSSGDSVISAGQVFQLSVDTTGFVGGTFALNLSMTDIGTDTAFVLSGGVEEAVTITNGSITIGVMNNTPTLDALSNLAIDEDAGEQVVGLSGISAGDSESQPLSVTATSSNPSLIPHPMVTYTSANATGSIAFSPALDQSGTATITVTVEDGGPDGNLATAADNATVERSFDVTVNPLDDVPVITSSDTLNVDENDQSGFTVEFGGRDAEQAHFFLITGGADKSQFLMDPDSGQWNFVSAPDFENSTDADSDNVYELEIAVIDAAFNRDTQTLTVTVANINEAPVFTMTPSSVADGGTTVGNVQADDEDLSAQTIVYGIDGGDDAGEFSIDAASGLLSFVGARDFSSPTDANGDNVYEVTVTADDQAGGGATQTLQITVLPPFTFDGETGELTLTAIDGLLVVDRDADNGTITLNDVSTGVSAASVQILRLLGSEDADIIDAGRLRSADIPNASVVINAFGGDDVVSGSRVADLIDAGAGNDLVIGGWGDDSIDGADGDDTLIGAAGNDVLSGGPGSDNLHGNSGQDIVNGDGGDDILRGARGNDTMNGADGHDTLLGQDGDDLLSGGTGNDVVDGGDGLNSLAGDDGDDRLSSTGQATINGGAGHDLITGSPFNDTITGADGNDTAFGGAGDDRIDGGNGEDVLVGDDGNDRLSGNSGNDTLDGSAGDDTMFGGSQVDVLIGQQGNDRADGGGGSGDIFRISSEDARFSTDVSITADEAVAGSERDSFAGIERVEVYLDDLPQFVDTRGFSGRSVVASGGGNDTVLTGDGADLIFAGAGDDVVDTGSGNDIVYAGTGNDAVHGRSGVDRLNGQADDDTILGGDGGDFLFGGGGRDTVLGEAGADIVRGNGGLDRIAGSGNGNLVDPGDVVIDDASDIDETFSFDFDALLGV